MNYTIGGQLYHHGIMGQKWGVRRYQNADGTLTEAGKKKYYDKKTVGDYEYYSLNKKGRKYNQKKNDSLKRYKDSTRYNAKKVNPNFNKELDNLDKISKKDNETFLEARDEFFRTGKFKNKKLKDWYEFKDAVTDDWIESEDGKEYRRIKKSLENMVREAAKQHPMYSKNYKILEDYSKLNEPPKMKDINIGEKVVKDIVNDIVWEYRLKNNKNSL